MLKYGVFIGRFQPFHNAHLRIVKEALKFVDKLIIVVGSADQPRTIKNPFTTDERTRMIYESLNDAGIRNFAVTYVADSLYNDNDWLADVQQAVDDEIDKGGGVYSDADIAIFGENKDASTFYLKMFPQWTFYELDLKMSDVSATKVRDLMFSQDKIGIKDPLPPKSHEFVSSFMQTKEFQLLLEEHRQNVHYKSQWDGAPFPPFFVTTDAVCVCAGHILVVRRKFSPGKGLIALPGGFVKSSELLVDSCVRELKEETGIKMTQMNLKRFIKASHVFDHPDRSLRGRTITHAYLIELDNDVLPQVKGLDDADKSWWMKISDVRSARSSFFEDHYHIINKMLTKR